MANNSLPSPIESALANAPTFGLPESFKQEGKQQPSFTPGNVPFQSYFNDASRKYGVPVNVLMALAQQESSFNPTALGQKTQYGRAKGLMQYIDSTAAGMGINPYDPVQSIDAAAKQLKTRMDKGYSMQDAVSAHFGGDDRRQWGPKTRAYGVEVLGKAQRFFDGTSGPIRQPQQQGIPEGGAEYPTTQAATTGTDMTALREQGAKIDALLTQLNKDEPDRYRAITQEEIAKIQQTQQQPQATPPVQQQAPAFHPEAVPPLRSSVDDNLASYLARFGHALGNSYDDMKRSMSNAAFLVKGGDTSEVASNIAASMKLHQEEQSGKTLGQKRLAATLKAVSDASGFKNTAAKGWEAVKTAFHEPGAVGLGAAESAASMIPTIAGSLTGAGAGAGVGAGVGAVAGGAGAAPGAVAGALWGGRGGMIAGTTAMEAGAELEQMVQERLTKQGKEPTAANIKALLDNDEFIANARTRGAAKGLTIAGMDLLTMGIAGRILSAPAKAAEKQAIKTIMTDTGVDAVAARSLLASPAGRAALEASAPGTLKKALAPVAAFSVELLGEPAGEAASQAVARDNVDWGDVAAEGIFGAGSAAAGTVAAKGVNLTKDKIANLRQGDTSPQANLGRAMQDEVDSSQFAESAQQQAAAQMRPGDTVNPGPRGQAAPSSPIDGAPADEPAVPSASRDDTGLSATAGPLERAVRGTAPQPDDTNGNFWAGELGATVQVQAKGDPKSAFVATVERYNPDGGVTVREEGGAAYEVSPDQVDITAVGATPAATDQQMQDAGTTEEVKAERAKVEDQQTKERQAAIDKSLQEQGVDPETGEILDEAPAKPAAKEEVKPPQKSLDQMDEGELRDRMRYLATQAKANGGWDKLLSAARRDVEKVLDAKVQAQGATDAPVAPAATEPTKTTAQDADSPALTGADNKPKWFSSAEKAAAHLDKKGITGYAVQEVQPGRYELHRVTVTDEGTKPPTAKPAKTATNPRTNRVKKLVGDVGQTVSPSGDVGVLKSGGRYTIDQIEKNGTIHVTNQETGSGAAISMAEMEIGNSRRVAWTKVERETPQPSAAQSVAKEETAAPQAQQGEWQQFDEASGSLQVPRDQMPQIKAEHRGALVNFLNARGVAHQEQIVPASSLKATQAEFSPERVAKAAERTEGDRSILVSSDGHILDGHHQWLAAKESGEDIKVIRLDAPIRDLIALGQEFPSSTLDTSTAEQVDDTNVVDLNQPSDLPAKSVSGEKVTAPAPAEASKPTTEEQSNTGKTEAESAKQDADQFSGNKLFTADKVAAARARMRSKFGQINSGIDPEMLVDGMTIAGAYIESGVRKFSDYASAMVGDFGDGVKPYLLSFWEGARNYPGLDNEGMTSVADSAKEHTALLAPADVSTPAVGEVQKAPAKRSRKTGQKGDITLTQDWGVDHVDGYGENTSGRETGSDLKDGFLKEARQYLNAVADALENVGFKPATNAKGKPMGAVNVNAGGDAVSGDVSLTMDGPSGTGAYVNITGTSLRGVVPTTTSGISIMYRTNTPENRYSGGTNQWAPVSLSATDLANLVNEHVGKVARQTSVAPDSVVNKSENQPKTDDLGPRPTTGLDKMVAEFDAEVTRNGTTTELGEPGAPALAGTPASPVRGAAEERQARGDSAAGSTANGQRDGRPGAAGDERTGSVGDDARKLPVPARGSAPAGRTAAERSSTASRDGDAAERGRSNHPAAGITSQDRPADLFTINPDEIGQGGDKTKYANNVAAIRVLKDLEATGREVTADDQATLSKYVGWGGLPSAFARTDDTANKGWEKQVAELKALLTPAEYAAAAASTRNAHYTSPEIVTGMWKALRHLGFTGGRVIEPSVGVGNFFGLMPLEERGSSALHGVELDHITSGIATALYPDAKIARMGYQAYAIPDGYFDVAIGNPPFGSEKLHDGNRKDLSGFSIHNYFFARSVDALRPGGVLAMVVTNRFLDGNSDKARQYIAARADLVGAIRLPNNAFAKNAGTEVTTDIIILQRRAPGQKASGTDWMNSVDFTDKNGAAVPLNEYFHAHPENMLGEFGAYGTMYRAGDSALVATEGQNTQQLLDAAINRLPQGILESAVTVQPETRETVKAENARVGSMFISGDGRVMVRGEDVMGERTGEAVEFRSDKAEERVKGMLRLRDNLSRLRQLQLSNTATDAAIEEARDRLNKTYDGFVKSNGPINSQANKLLFRDDPTWPQISALEDSYDRGVSAAVAKTTGEAPRPQSAEKAAIFTKRTQQPYSAPTSAKTAKDALVSTLSERGRVDMDLMMQLYGKTEEQIAEELGELLFSDPDAGWQTRDQYLSGNVKQKLARAREAAKASQAYGRNVEALQAVQPKDIEAVDINVKPGATWIPADTMAAFADHLTEKTGSKAFYNPLNANWSFPKLDATSSATARFGTSRMSIGQIIEAAAAQKAVQIYDEHRDGTRTLNETETQLANDKVNAVKQEWDRWIWSDDARRTALSRQYNDQFNTDVRREFDGAHLSMPGKISNDIIKLRPHQNNAVWRIVQGGSTLTDHTVGSGKTFTLIAAAMELRRLDLARKPMFVVPNHLVGQWAQDFIKLYPGARVMAASKRDFEKANRKRFFARIATGDWDAVIVAHTSFGKVGMKPETEAEFIQEEIADLTNSIDLIEAAEGKKSRNVKQAAERRTKMEEKLKSLLDTGNKDDSLYWDDLGIDALFVDECFSYDTQVETDKGMMKIGDIVVNRLRVNVKSVNSSTHAIEWKPVVNWYANTRKGQLIEVFHEKGSFICTANHKIYVDGHGYKRAGELEPTDRIVTSKGVYSENHAERACYRAMRMVQDGHFVSGEEAAPLLQRVLQNARAAQKPTISGEVEGRYAGNLEQLPTKGKEEPCIIGAHETQQSDAFSISAEEDVSVIKGEEPQASSARGEWTPHGAASHAGQTDGVGDGVSDKHQKNSQDHGRPSELLQGRSGLHQEVASGGSGRVNSPQPIGAGARHEEDESIISSGLVGIAILEPGSDGEYSFSGRNHSVVYDIEVADNHNYFANGVRVSNCHEFKNLAYSTGMRNVAGLGSSAGSQKATDLYMKTRVVRKATGGRNVVFATGTPISNTMAEMYTMQRYLDYDNLKQSGMSHFDAWARMFGEVVTDWELSPSGQYKLNSRFSKFVNMPELMQRYTSFADVINRDDINRMLASQGKRLPVPKVKGGKPQNVVVDRSAWQAAYIGEPLKDADGNDTDNFPEGSLVHRAENLPKKAEKGGDNMLKIMSDARKAALDMRLIDPDYPDNPDSKVNFAANNIKEDYDRWHSDKGAQLVFIDLSTPKGARAEEAAHLRDLVERAESRDPAVSDPAQAELDKMSPDDIDALKSAFSVYDDLKQKLIERGIPTDEIAFIHDAKTDLQKTDLFAKVRSGRVRVLFGSTAKMGAGMNVQERLVALHHLDAPWRPSDLEQREGRIIRQGNKLYDRDPEGFEVGIYRYATKQTLDSRMWQTIEGKATFIEQVRKGDTGAREIEDVAGEAANAAEMKAASSGNPLILEEMALRQRIRTLENERTAHDRDQFRIRDRISMEQGNVKNISRALVDLRADENLPQPVKFEATIEGQTFDKRKDAGEAILQQAQLMELQGLESKKIGTYGGFNLTLEKLYAETYALEVSGSGTYTTKVKMDDDPAGLSVRMTNSVRDLPAAIEKMEDSLTKSKEAIPALQAQVKPWQKEEQLKEATARHSEVIDQLKPKKKTDEQAVAKPATEATEPQFNDLSTSTIEVDGKQRPTTNSSGKPIHPTEEGIRNFWRWFGDSKVVDDQGRPMVVYHGTSHDFDAFEKEGRRGRDRMHYFTDDNRVAGEYAGSVQNGSPTLIPAYLAVDNPFQFDAGGQLWGSLPITLFSDKMTELFGERNILKGSQGTAPRVGFTAVARAAKAMGYDGVIANNILDGGGSYGEQTPTQVQITFSPEQIKSAIGNTGEFDATKPEIYADLTTDAAYARLPESNRIQLATRLRKLEQQKDKLTPEQYSERLGELAGWLEERSYENAFKRATAERQRGADLVLERLHRARRQGEISEEAADIAIWALNRNPQLAEELGFSISSKGGSNYDRAERIAKLMTEGMRDTAPIHEILHHTERMMPPGVQKGIAAAYNKAWARAYKKATPEQRAALDALRISAFGNKAAKDAMMKAFESGLLNYDEHYQLTNASEYWAVNAANIMAARHGASQQGWIARAKEWIRDFIQKARAVFGLPATAAVLKGLDAVTKGDGSFLSNRMLATNPHADTPVRDLSGDYADMPTSSSGMEPDPQIPTEEEDNNRLRRWWDKAKDLIKNGPTDATTDAMQKGLALIPFRPLVQEMARNLPAAAEYLRLKQSMDAMRNRWHAKTDEVAQKWLKYRKDNKDENVTLMNLMHEATIAQVDPSQERESTVTNRDREALRFAKPGSDKEKELLKKITEDKQAQEDWEQMTSRYEALSPQAKQVFKQVRDAYTSLADAYEKVLLGNMEKAINVRIKKAERENRYELQRIKDEGLTGEERDDAMDAAAHKLRIAKTKTAWNRKARMTQLRQQFEMNRLKGPYFPLARFGNLFVTVRDAQTGKVQSFSKFEKASEQREFADLMRENKDYKVQVGTLDDTGSLRKAVDPNFVADVEDILADLPNAESVKDEVWQRYLESLPDFSVRKNRIHRTGKAGFNADALRAFGNSMFHGSHQLARLAHSFDMEEALDASREEANTSKDSVRDGLVVNELEKRHQFIMNPTGGPLVQKITQAAFIYALAASPKAAIVNLSQTAIMGIPMLAAYEGGANGVTRSANQLTRALGDFTKGKGHAQNSKRLTADERKAMAEAYETGIIDRTQSHDLAGIGETGVEYSPARTKVMSWLAWGFHHTERLNREVTFLAAYRMARAKGLPHVGAVMKAGDLTWKIHFDYQNTSRPRLMHNDTMKALLVFRNFTINMLYRLFRDIHQAANGDTPEVRREAKIQLAGITGMMMLSAGITGTWGFGIMMALAGAFMDDDKDPEAELKKNMVEALGPMMAGIILDGVPGYATGTSLSDSIGMKDLWFRSPSTQLEGKEEADYWKSQLLGAAPSMVDNVVRGYGMLKEGQTYRGIETMMPKAIKDPMKAMRYATEGATNKRGDTIVDQVGAMDVLRQALGFVPAKISEQYDINNAGYNLQESILHQRQALMDAWWKAEEAGKEAKLESLEKDIDAYNDKYPEQEITPKTLRRSAKTREDNAENATGGMRYNRKLRDRILEDQAPTIYR